MAQKLKKTYSWETNICCYEFEPKNWKILSETLNVSKIECRLANKKKYKFNIETKKCTVKAKAGMLQLWFDFIN